MCTSTLKTYSCTTGESKYTPALLCMTKSKGDQSLEGLVFFCHVSLLFLLKLNPIQEGDDINKQDDKIVYCLYKSLA